MLGLVLTSDSVEGYARDLARLQKRMLSHRLPQAINLKTRLQRGIESACELRKETKSTLTAFYVPCQTPTAVAMEIFISAISWLQGWLLHNRLHECLFWAPIWRHRPNFVPYGDVRGAYHVYGESNPKTSATRNRIAEVYLEDMGVSRQELSKWLVVTAAARHRANRRTNG